ncbi:uncharacterized protein BDR25DRAFT_349367 [Lindgomyces ingoldianus]|uniref:Uncharacterized protein n=1 Tax=Lindgomyces ingoldianus TaxID=673940 RepID=A0ACB6RD51_9PLEO|nr:uncharacterized protein BDR25DRAFT_349367 [Lindgomyces ingoldianus]KAF2476257.1 hypothetical protein BDR25DRAFT_349367 [Lindgomyces ingoldianus]
MGSGKFPGPVNMRRGVRGEKEFVGGNMALVEARQAAPAYGMLLTYQGNTDTVDYLVHNGGVMKRADSVAGMSSEGDSIEKRGGKKRVISPTSRSRVLRMKTAMETLSSSKTVPATAHSVSLLPVGSIYQTTPQNYVVEENKEEDKGEAVAGIQGLGTGPGISNKLMDRVSVPGKSDSRLDTETGGQAITEIHGFAGEFNTSDELLDRVSVSRKSGSFVYTVSVLRLPIWPRHQTLTPIWTRNQYPLCHAQPQFHLPSFSQGRGPPYIVRNLAGLMLKCRIWGFEFIDGEKTPVTGPRTGIQGLRDIDDLVLGANLSSKASSLVNPREGVAGPNYEVEGADQFLPDHVASDLFLKVRIPPSSSPILPSTSSSKNNTAATAPDPVITAIAEIYGYNPSKITRIPGPLLIDAPMGFWMKAKKRNWGKRGRENNYFVLDSISEQVVPTPPVLFYTLTDDIRHYGMSSCIT